MTHVVDSRESQIIRNEITELERQLQNARKRLNATCNETLSRTALEVPAATNSYINSSQHFLLLVADSALPLGSFAFSSGLESYLAHIRPSSFATFLILSLASYTSTTLPFVTAAHRNPHDLVYLDDALDAAIMCTVGRRASVAQGRALLSLWDRSFRGSVPAGSSPADSKALDFFSSLLRSCSLGFPSNTGDLPSVSAHLAPLFGVVAKTLGLSLQQTAYVFVLGHVKALLSAAVRASLFGPYQAQNLLASRLVQDSIDKTVRKEWLTKIEDAGQSIPVMDLWIGRHEMLYSRIFNS